MLRIIFFALALPALTAAQSILIDTNGDQIVNATAVGDSITRGVGDFFGSGNFIEAAETPAGGQEAGYPLRIETLLGISVLNQGVPGDQLTDGEVPRFVSVLNSTNTDVILLNGGSNDSIFRVSSGRIFRALQTIVNFARVRGKEIVLVNITPTCCDREDREVIIEMYNEQYSAVAALNNVRLANVFKGFVNTCDGIIEECFLLSRPEGLHPNIEGYDVMGEVVAAAILGIDIFSVEGQRELIDALGVTSIATIPDAPAALP